MNDRKKVVVITGSAQGIGQAIKQEFERIGFTVYGIDKQVGEFYQGNLNNPKDMEDFVQAVLSRENRVDILINNAAPISVGLDEGTLEEFEEALRVGVTAPFLLTKLLKEHFSDGASIINITSTRSTQSQPQTESYSAAKGGLSALTHALAVSLLGKVRVNAIAPGWIETSEVEHSGADASQHLVNRVGSVMDIAKLVLFLCSDEAGFISGETITVDGGMSRQMIYHGDGGWRLE